jgi:hypothetical protein
VGDEGISETREGETSECLHQTIAGSRFARHRARNSHGTEWSRTLGDPEQEKLRQAAYGFGTFDEEITILPQEAEKIELYARRHLV